MELVKTIIRNGLNQNAKELKAGIVELNPYKKLVEKNKGFDFNVKIGYSRGDDLLELCYEISMIGKRITIQFLINELRFDFYNYDITKNLLRYADSYFNNKEFKINVGDFDGDYLVGIEDYIKSCCLENDKVNLFIYDEILDIYLVE